MYGAIAFIPLLHVLLTVVTQNLQAFLWTRRYISMKGTICVYQSPLTLIFRCEKASNVSPCSPWMQQYGQQSSHPCYCGWEFGWPWLCQGVGAPGWGLKEMQGHPNLVQEMGDVAGASKGPHDLNWPRRAEPCSYPMNNKHLRLRSKEVQKQLFWRKFAKHLNIDL